MRVLGIESSCDETAAAVVGADGRVLSNVVSSQIQVHAPYGGVVPELAARAHMTHVMPVVEGALQPIEGGLDGVDAIAVTHGPGLVGALLVGMQVAKSIAFTRGLPLIGVNHLVGHLLAVHLREENAPEPPPYPYVALLVSGGHTALYDLRSPSEIEQLGQTRDDAAGEAFDKVAKLLGLGYPGGPVIDRLAARGDSTAFELPRPMASRRNLEFSFSGLKTAVAQHVAKQGAPRSEQKLADFCASFQARVVDVLARKSVHACQQQGVEDLVLTGGVAANRGLRQRARELCEKAGIRLHVPPISACTDNAAMIAYAGACKLAAGRQDDLSLPVFSRSPVLGEKAHLPNLRSIKRPREPKASRQPGER